MVGLQMASLTDQLEHIDVCHRFEKAFSLLFLLLFTLLTLFLFLEKYQHISIA